MNFYRSRWPLSHGSALQVSSLRNTDICSGKSEKITRLQFVKSELLPRTLWSCTPLIQQGYDFHLKFLHTYLCTCPWLMGTCVCTHTLTWGSGLQATLSLGFYCQTKVFCSYWWYRTPRRSLKNIWSVRGMTVKRGFAHFPVHTDHVCWAKKVCFRAFLHIFV